MQRVLSYFFASMASVVGWKLGNLGGPVPGYFLAIVAASLTLWFSKRWLRELLG